MLRKAGPRRDRGADAQIVRADARRPRFVHQQQERGGEPVLHHRERKLMIRTTYAREALRAALLAGALGLSAQVAAQLTTSTIRGTVANAPAPGAAVTAVNVDTGFTTSVTVGANGSYVLSGLRPGTYDIKVAGGASQRVIV